MNARDVRPGMCFEHPRGGGVYLALREDRGPDREGYWLCAVLAEDRLWSMAPPGTVVSAGPHWLAATCVRLA